MNARLILRKGCSTVVLLLASGTAAISFAPPTTGQGVPALPGLNGATQPGVVSTRTRSGIDIRFVTLDGYQLFQIAAPELNGDTEEEQLPVERRTEAIESQLYAVIDRGFDPDSLEVTYRILNNLPVIYVRDDRTLEERPLMTVTHVDAELGVADVEERAKELRDILQTALLRAYSERQSSYLIQQAKVSVGVILGMVLLSWGVRRLQQQSKGRCDRLKEDSKRMSDSAPDVRQPAMKNTRMDTLAFVQQKLSLQQRIDFHDLLRRLLQAGQVAVWGSGTSYILGLFPYTRSLQPLLFAAPLKILGVALVCYVGVRLIMLGVDRFFAALEDGYFLDPRASRRLALRISTFSRVLKSATALLGLVTGTMISLSILGVNLTPILAGAGILGIAISLGSQNLIKDAINGFLILVEDQYAVGDAIVVGNVGGFVEYMSLRITQLRNNEGRLITIPHGAISVVENLSKEWSRIDFTIDIAYDTHPDRALKVISEVIHGMYGEWEWKRRMPEPPEVLGIDEIRHDGLLIRVWIKTIPLEQWSVAREFRRRLKPALDRAGIRVGAPQHALWFRSSLDLLQPGNGTAESAKSPPPSAPPRPTSHAPDVDEQDASNQGVNAPLG